eukprot:764889-Hanusia_phi.AAC.9
MSESKRRSLAMLRKEQVCSSIHMPISLVGIHLQRKHLSVFLYHKVSQTYLTYSRGADLCRCRLAASPVRWSGTLEKNMNMRRREKHRSGKARSEGVGGESKGNSALQRLAESLALPVSLWGIRDSRTAAHWC